jgi:Pyruvate/2-oxoacid:ferredoxin oxidoreductase gamma subunit
MAARELPSILYANMILLGFLVRETGIVRKESVESVLAKHPRAQENLKAFHLGLASEK